MMNQRRQLSMREMFALMTMVTFSFAVAGLMLRHSRFHVATSFSPIQSQVSRQPDGVIRIDLSARVFNEGSQSVWVPDLGDETTGFCIPARTHASGESTSLSHRPEIRRSEKWIELAPRASAPVRVTYQGEDADQMLELGVILRDRWGREEITTIRFDDHLRDGQLAQR